jgi:hypothetical protein
MFNETNTAALITKRISFLFILRFDESNNPIKNIPIVA